MERTATYRLAPYAVLRAERFGGLIYRYDNRRLYFLHAPALVELLNALDGSVTLDDALDMLPTSEPVRGQYMRALAHLERLGVIIRVAPEADAPHVPPTVAPA
ncbi:MAG: mycofactocin biosynthesis chaperone MftB [Chloroflexi bacterium]|nr:mycofactocin biosynthesis chaperone MftB [Chloroflexota bacterium]